MTDATISAMDPFAVLGVKPGAAPADVTAAYRRLAKRWHPDRAAGADASARMAQINAAYDLVRSGAWQRPDGPLSPPVAATAPSPEGGRRAAAGAWLAPALRRALGRELLVALEDGEAVALVTPAATWASPRTLLALTDRRLLWLLDDAPTHRVRALRFDAIVAVEDRLRRPFGRSACLDVRSAHGRRLTFAELRPATARTIAAHVRAALADPPLNR